MPSVDTRVRAGLRSSGVDSDPGRRHGPERGSTGGGVVLGASPPARHFRAAILPVDDAPTMALEEVATGCVRSGIRLRHAGKARTGRLQSPAGGAALPSHVHPTATPVGLSGSVPDLGLARAAHAWPARGARLGADATREGNGMATRVGINGFGRIGRNFFRAHVRARRRLRDRRRQRPRRREDDGAPARVRLRARPAWRARSRSATATIRAGDDGAEGARRARPRRAALGRPRGRRRDRVDRDLHEARRRAEAPRRRRAEGDHLGARDRARRDDRARRERRRLRPRASTTSSRTPPARRTASRRSPRCCTTRSGSSRAS